MITLRQSGDAATDIIQDTQRLCMAISGRNVIWTLGLDLSRENIMTHGTEWGGGMEQEKGVKEREQREKREWGIVKMETHTTIVS